MWNGKDENRVFVSVCEKGVLMKCLESRYAMMIVTAGVLMASGFSAQARSPSESVKIVKGEVSQVKGEFQMARDRQGEDTLDIVDKFYVITDQSGKEMRLELTDDTEVLNRVTPGDKIEAKISAEGHTLSVTRLEP
jgi:hypothetical protein